MTNQIFTIKPYKHNGAWVFDDPARDIVKEPFVSGVPDMIEKILHDLKVEHADLGFRLIFSEGEYPAGIPKFKLNLINPENDGAWYALVQDDVYMKGWLCPALLKYFDAPPEELWVSVEQISHHGKLRVWAIRNPPRSPDYWDVPHLDAAVWFIKGLIDNDLQRPWVAANVFGLEVFEEGDWSEWENKDGDDVMILLERAMT